MSRRNRRQRRLAYEAVMANETTSLSPKAAVECCSNVDCHMFGVLVPAGKCVACHDYTIPTQELDDWMKDWTNAGKSVPQPKTQAEANWEKERKFERTQIGRSSGTPVTTITSLPLGSTVKKADDFFSCPADLTGCPVASRPEVRIPSDMYMKWVMLAQQFDTEWLAWLQGTIAEDGSVDITGMYFPKQKATGVHVQASNDNEREPEGTVAAVHSHVGMDVFFSKEDELHLNHHCELIVNRAGKLASNIRTKLECGRWHRGPATVKILQTDEFKVLKDALAPPVEANASKAT